MQTKSNIKTKEKENEFWIGLSIGLIAGIVIGLFRMGFSKYCI